MRLPTPNLLCALALAAPWLAAAQPQPAQTGRPPTEPILRIEAGGHLGTVRAPRVDAKGRFMITVGTDDYTARVWKLPELRLVKVLRPPLGALGAGQLWSAAL